MMNITVSPYAMVEPKLKTPITPDMQDIVDAFRRAGLIRKKPGAFQLGNQLIVHPDIYRELQHRIDNRHNVGSLDFGGFYR